MIKMTENKLAAQNTHTDTFPINQQLIPYVKDKCEVSKEHEIICKKSSWELACQFMFTILGLFTMIVLTYPVFIFPRLIVVILPIEIAIADSIIGKIIKVKNGFNTHHDSVFVTNTISDTKVQNQVRISVYGRTTPT